jgi:hypothetical protein
MESGQGGTELGRERRTEVEKEAAMGGESGDRTRERGRQRIGISALTLGFGVVGGWGRRRGAPFIEVFQWAMRGAASDVGGRRGPRRRDDKEGGGAMSEASGGWERKRMTEQRLVVAG